MRDESCDALVIGSGVTGAMVAQHLAEAGLDVVIIDRRRLVMGSTCACTALVQYDVDTPLIDLAEKVGPESAKQAYSTTRKAIDDLVELIHRLKLNCDVDRRSGLYLATRSADVPRLQREAAARAELGIETSYLDRVDLLARSGIDRPGAILSEVQYELDPVRLTRELLRWCMERGVRAYHETEIGIDRSIGRTLSVKTTKNHTIHCREIVFATGYEAPEMFAQARDLCSLHSTFALASQPFEESLLWRDRSLLWELADPYLYARLTPDHRIIVGGEDEPFKNSTLRDALIPRKTRRIIRKMRALQPALHIESRFAWAGTFAETEDGLPLIGQADPSRQCWLALGYGGNGVTYSLIAAQVIRDLVLSRSNDSTALFSFDRLKR